MAASPLYVYMYVALDNMLVLLLRSGGKKATQASLNSEESAAITDLIHTLDIVLCQVIHPFVFGCILSSVSASLQSGVKTCFSFSSFKFSSWSGSVSFVPTTLLQWWAGNILHPGICLLNRHLIFNLMITTKLQKNATFLWLCADIFNRDGTSGRHFEAHSCRSNLMWYKYKHY